MKNFLTILFMIFAAAVVSFQFYLFYIADCEKVKEYWMVIQTPGRCL